MNAGKNAEAIAKREEASRRRTWAWPASSLDLHDRAGRMKAKGVIRDVLSWPRSRLFGEAAEAAPRRGRAPGALPRPLRGRGIIKARRWPGAPTTTTRPS